MNEVKKCFSKGFWLDSCTKQVVSARVCAYRFWFLPITLQVLIYMARQLCRQIAAYTLSRLTPFLQVWGVRKGEWGVGVILGRRPKICT
jgi:hypothetical protein